jgi:hypothetical protein
MSSTSQSVPTPESVAQGTSWLVRPSTWSDLRRCWSRAEIFCQSPPFMRIKSRTPVKKAALQLLNGHRCGAALCCSLSSQNSEARLLPAARSQKAKAKGANKQQGMLRAATATATAKAKAKATQPPKPLATGPGLAALAVRAPGARPQSLEMNSSWVLYFGARYLPPKPKQNPGLCALGQRLTAKRGKPL